MDTTTATAALANTVTPGQIVHVANMTGTVTESRPVPRGKNWALILDVGGQLCELRLPPLSAVAVLPGLPSTVRAEDHRPVDTFGTGTANGTECSCGWKPARRAARVSQWHAAYNRHARSLGLLGI